MKKPFLLLALLAMIFPFFGSQAQETESPKAVLVPESNSTYKYQFRFDDIVLGEHENGVNNSWNNGNPTGTDHRTRNFTMSAWVKAVSTEGQILGHGQSLFYGATGTFGVYLSGGKLTLKARAWEDSGNCPGIAEVATEATLIANEWAFISVVVDDDNRTIKLYKNGKLAGTGDLGTIVEGGEREGHGIGLLQDECVFFVGNGGFSCYVDEVQLWNKALTEKELKESILGGYTQGNIPQELIAYYKIESDSQAELENKGSYEGSCPAGVVQGTIEDLGWVQNYTCDFISVQIVEGHTFPSYQLTLTQPTTGGTFKVVDAENNKVNAGTILQYTALTVVAEPAEGYRLDQILVNDEPIEGTTFVIEDDTEVTVTFTDKATVSYTAVANGQIEMFVNDATEATAFGSEITMGSKVTLKITPAEGYELTSLLINGKEKIDEVTDNTYTIASLDGNTTVEATFAEQILYWQVTCIVEGDGTVDITDEEGTVYPSGYDQIPSNVNLKLVFKPAENYKVSEFAENNPEGDNISLFDQIQNNEYTIGHLTGSKIYTVKFTEISGINNANTDALSIYCQNGMLYVNGASETASVTLFDLAGKQVLTTSETPANISFLANGCYLVQVKDGDMVKTVKLLKR